MTSHHRGPRLPAHFPRTAAAASAVAVATIAITGALAPRVVLAQARSLPTIVAGYSPPDVAYARTYTVDKTGAGKEGASITAGPRFVSPLNDDFRLNGGSPVAGWNLLTAPLQIP